MSMKMSKSIFQIWLEILLQFDKYDKVLNNNTYRMKIRTYLDSFNRNATQHDNQPASTVAIACLQIWNFWMNNTVKII